MSLRGPLNVCLLSGPVNNYAEHQAFYPNEFSNVLAKKIIPVGTI
ncbi:hypothetical protein VT98_12791 [Candidatus Electrothrix communis]|uniref:Uncharacterized protein n=1 Tax=Candidatus Electrothrix communis TaxID=1859133 RepID=A0A3S3QJV9_9BACT|nr:hypothetical protein VT98_12791 [Candidatus Electrothrix communis]